MKRLRAVNDGIEKAESLLLVIIVVLMIALSFSQVVLRNFFSWGFSWGDVGLRNMVLWVGFIGASVATKQDRHITIDALTKFLSPAWKAIANCLTSFFSFALSLVFIYASVAFIRTEYQAGGIAFLGIPFWEVQLIIPVGFGLMGLRFLIKVIEDIDCLRTRLKNSS